MQLIKTHLLYKIKKEKVTLGHIIFEDGVLAVPKQKQNLQKLTYHYTIQKKVLYILNGKLK